MFQRYVSDELMHFVGARFLGNLERQYEVLVEILHTGQLKAQFRGPDGKIHGMFPCKGNAKASVLTTDPSGTFADGTLYLGTTVCFCDIPLADLGIHMGKYGQFGLSFRKSFLVPKGASPVFYVAADAIVGEERLGQKIERIARGINDFWACAQDLDLAAKSKTDAKLNSALRAIFELPSYLLASLKFFDSQELPDSLANTYMEREWRVARDISFELKDVYRVILPETYAQHFHDDFPDYSAQVTFAEPLGMDTLNR